MIGEIKLFAFGGVHVHGFIICDGRDVSVARYPALYSLIGTQFGGDGKSTFRLPRLAPPAPNVVYAIGAVDDDYPLIED